MNEVEFYIDKIAKYYDVIEQSQVANKLDVSSQSLSNIKSRNSLSTLKKYCLRAGIYEDIFGDSNIIISQGSHSRAGGRNYLENINSSKNIEFEDSNIIISQGSHSRAGGRNYLENINSSKSIEFEDLTILLIKSLIEKYGEEELQYKLMELKRNV